MIVQQLMLPQVVRMSQPPFSSQELRRAQRSQTLGKQRLRVQIRIVAAPEPDRKIDLVAPEIRERDSRRNTQIDVGIAIGEVGQPGDQPFGREGGSHADGQRLSPGRCRLAADRARQHFEAKLNVGQHSHAHVGKRD